jgi:hypothetical protein
MNENLNSKIDKAMQSLDGIEKASPRPFFFTRLEARMKKQRNGWEKLSYFLSKPVVAIACICLIIMINAAVILSSSNLKNSTDQQNNELATADEYNSVSAPLYEFVNSTP